jgi:crossover junction endodeoxyribonuclease RusA
MKVELPWPPAALWPNRRSHWGKKSRTAQKVRADAHTLTFQAWWADGRTRERGNVRMLIEHGEQIPVRLTFCPPTRRSYDVDNALAACKSMLDGVADGIAVDDSRFQLTLERGEVVKGGKVVVEISVLPVSRRFEDRPWSSV